LRASLVRGERRAIRVAWRRIRIELQRHVSRGSAVHAPRVVSLLQALESVRIYHNVEVPRLRRLLHEQKIRSDPPTAQGVAIFGATGDPDAAGRIAIGLQ
jgi:hypothetical protein